MWKERVINATTVCVHQVNFTPIAFLFNNHNSISLITSTQLLSKIALVSLEVGIYTFCS